jgi:hypothetical protein
MLNNQTDPLILADGTVINPVDGSVVLDDESILVEVPNTEQIQRELVIARTRIIDLPVPPQQMNSLSVIIGYTLFGVTDKDIATLLHIDMEQLTRIKESESYSKVYDGILDNIVQSDMNNVRDMFAQNSINAAGKMKRLLDSESEAIQLNAAKDILDRAGHRPVDVVEHKHKMEGGLVIEFIERRDDDIPTIDITPKGDF